MDRVTSRQIVENIRLEERNIEYRFPLPSGTSELTVRVRETEDMVQVAFVSGGQVRYANLGNGFQEFRVEGTKGGELFFRTDKPVKTVEVMVKV